MKPATAYTAAQRYASRQSIAWLLRLTAFDGASWRTASRAMNSDGEDYLPAIAASPEWEMSSVAEFGPGGLIASRAVVRVNDIVGASGSFAEWSASRPPIGLRAELRLLWLDADGTWTPDDAVMMLKGIVTKLERGPASITLTIQDELSAAGDRRIGRILTPAMTGGESSPLIGQPLPILIGMHESAPLLELRPGAAGRLAEPLGLADAVITLVSLDGFPTSGVVQIGDELIQYSAIDATLKTLGTPSQPILRGPSPQPYDRGDPARQVPPGGFQWLAADHPCAQISQIFAEDALLPGGAWSAALRTLGAFQAQIVKMDKWPLAAGRHARRLTARVEGWPDGLGGFINNPADVLNLLMTHARFGGVATGDLDSASLAALRTLLAAQGFHFSRRIEDAPALRSLLDSAARECAAWVRCGRGKINFLAADVGPSFVDSREDLDESKALEPLAAAELAPAEGARSTDALDLVIAADLERAVWSKSDPAAAGNGQSPARVRLRWLDGANETALTYLGERIWSSLREPLLTHRQSFPIGAGLLEPGDSIIADRAVVGLDRTPGWIESLKLRGAVRAEIVIRAPAAGEYCWLHDAETFLRHFGFGARLTLYISGRAVMSLDVAGNLSLRGRMTEDADFGSAPVAAPIVFSGGYILFSTGSGGSFTPFLRLDSDGNAELNGRVTEQSGIAFGGEGPCRGADATRFWLAPNARDGTLEFRSAESELHLAGILIESTPL